MNLFVLKIKEKNLNVRPAPSKSSLSPKNNTK